MSVHHSSDPPRNISLVSDGDSDSHGIGSLAISQHSEDILAVHISDDGIAIVIPSIAIDTAEGDLDQVHLVVSGPDALAKVAADLGIALLDILEEVSHGGDELGDVGDIDELDNLVAGGHVDTTSGWVGTAGLDAGDGDAGEEGVSLSGRLRNSEVAIDAILHAAIDTTATATMAIAVTVVFGDQMEERSERMNQLRLWSNSESVKLLKGEMRSAKWREDCLGCRHWPQ